MTFQRNYSVLMGDILLAGRLVVLKREFTPAARATGCSGQRIVLQHLLPDTTGQVVVAFSFALADAIPIKSALSFLDLGLPLCQPQRAKDGQT